jgi:hypothetical protein
MSGDPFNLARPKPKPMVLEIRANGCLIRVQGLGGSSCGLPEVLREAALQAEKHHETMGFVVIGSRPAGPNPWFTNYPPVPRTFDGPLDAPLG